MELRRKFSVVIVAFALILSSAYIVSAQQSANVVPVVSWSEPATPAQGYGATRVDRDFGAFHKDDSNQFGDDRAYNASDGSTNREADFQVHHWIPNTYGLMGDYGRDSNN